ncbi:MAG: HAD family hydrolase [Acidimicrobiales bacterium]
MAIEAVTFDYWNTLMADDPVAARDHRLTAWLGLIEGAGFAVERAALDAAHDSAWQTYVRSWKANEQFTAARSAEHCLDHLGLTVPADLRDQLVVELVRSAGGAELHLTEGVADVLRALKGAGLRLGIVCDVGFTPSTDLRRHLDRLGVLGLFDAWSFSDEVGCYKPAPEIFAHAAAGLDHPDPARTVHVGDLRRTDVAGARAAGWTSVRYAGVFDDQTAEPEADHVITRHADLPALLSLA